MVITDISSRASSNFYINDIIIEVQKTPIKSIADLKNINSIFKKGEKICLKNYKSKQSKTLSWCKINDSSKKIILLAGQTASENQNCNLSCKNNEIINDSMQIYREFSILSSRPRKI